MTEPIISLRGISKAFPGVQALQGVSFDILKGSCHALCGENGAGKSTLGKILGGIYQADSGTLVIEGKERSFAGPQEAFAAGIAMVHQELLFCENLSVAENLCLDSHPSRLGFVDWKQVKRQAEEKLASIGADLDVSQPLGSLPVAKQQLVQIAAGVGRGAKALVLDEPTSSLTLVETDNLKALVKRLLAGGVTIIYVSHRLEEIFDLCDRVTVLRDGVCVGTELAASLNRDSLINMMIGRELEADSGPQSVRTDGAEVLSAENLASPGKFEDISFSLKQGEILGLAGLVGSGRTEVCEALFGLDASATGTLTIHGRKGPLPKSVDHALKLGLGMAPEDRKRHGLVLSMNSRENVTLPILDRLASATFIRSAEEKGAAQQFFDRMRVKAPSIDSASAGLSGGNQQKLVIAKWLAAEAEILIIDEPTRGVDVGAKAEIHMMLRELAASGKSLILVSSDLPELLSLATRILVMRNGRTMGELPGGCGEEPVMRLMTGGSVL